MFKKRISMLLVLLVFVAPLTACTPVQAETRLVSKVNAAQDAEVKEFEEVSITVDSNRGVVDTQIDFWFAADDYFRVVEIIDPNGAEVLRLESHEPNGLGTHETLSKTPDMYYDKTKPDVEAHEAWVKELFESYPEGTYHFYGEGYGGTLWHSTAELSHEQPDTTEILYPTEGSVITVGDGPVVVKWTAVDGVVEWLLEWEKGGQDTPDQLLSINLPGDVTQFEVPASVVPSGTEYKVSIIGFAENGNSTSLDSNFSTE